MPPQEMGDGRGADAPDRLLWQRCQETDAAEDEAARFLDLAAYAEGLADEDERERIDALLAGDALAAVDVAAARSLAWSEESAGVVAADILARASALVGGAAPIGRGRVIPFPLTRARPLNVQIVASWSGIAAAMLLASWLGFAMGNDTYSAIGAANQASDDSFLRDFLDPSTGFLRDLTEGMQS